MADVIRTRKEVYDPRYAEFRKDIESFDIQALSTDGEYNFSAGVADFDLVFTLPTGTITEYTVPSGKEAILWAMSSSSDQKFVATAQVDVGAGYAPAVVLRGLANQYQVLWGTRKEPLAVIPENGKVKLQFKSATNGDYTGSLHMVLLPVIRKVETD